MKLNNLPVFLALLLVSCAAMPVVVPGNLTAAELIQRAQEASDKNRYSESLQYYAAVSERFPYDVDNTCAAEYGTAFVHYKQKKYDLAKEEFNNLLGRYNVSDEELLPPQFKILSNIVLAKIQEAEDKRNKGR